MVEDFLVGMLQYPNQAHGFADGVRPNDAIVLSGRTGNAKEDIMTHAAAKVGNAYEMPSKVTNGTFSTLAAKVHIPLPLKN